MVEEQVVVVVVVAAAVVVVVLVVVLLASLVMLHSKLRRSPLPTLLLSHEPCRPTDEQGSVLNLGA